MILDFWADLLSQHTFICFLIGFGLGAMFSAFICGPLFEKPVETNPKPKHTLRDDTGRFIKRRAF